MNALSYLKYPSWTLWHFLITPRLALRNTRIILAAFWRTTIVGRRAIRVLRLHSQDCTARWMPQRWSVSRRGRYIWRVAQQQWARWIIKRAGLAVRTVGYERVDWAQPHIIVVNHQSTIDALMIIALIPNGRLVAKKEILRYPFIGPAARFGGQIIVDRQDHASGQNMKAIRQGMAEWSRCNLIFFPEGTRTLTGQVGDFRLGAFAIAQELGLPIVPVAISGAFEALPKGSLLRLRQNPAIRVEIGEEIAIDGPRRRDVKRLGYKVRRTIINMMEGG